MMQNLRSVQICAQNAGPNVLKVARGFTACLKIYPENLTAISIGFKTRIQDNILKFV